MVSAGRVLIIPKGAYNPATTYEMLDLVSYNGSSYIAKTTTTGNLPTDTTYWQLSAYGGQAANIAGNFAEIETSSIATSVHYENDIFVDENSQLMKAIQTINIGDTIDENTNCTPTTVEALISYLSSYVDSLDSLNKKIQGAIEIAAQTDLHSLAIGEYYKKQSTFYITNGPTGIDQDPTAIFRLTVEAALDNASQASSPLILTLRTPDGKIYTQGFDGTIWGSWKQIADKSSLDVIEARVDAVEDSVADVETSSTASKAYAIGESFYYNDVLYKATAAISQGGTITPGTNCTPEKIIEKIDELVSENQTLTNQVSDISDEIADMNNILGAKNLLLITAKTQTFKGVTFTKNSDGSITANGTATEDIGFTLARIADLGISGNCILSGCTGGDSENTFALVITNEVNKEQAQETSEIIVNMADYSSPTYPTSAVYILIRSGVTISNKTFYPMLRLATDASADYQPYAMTNQQMTPYVQAISNPNLLDNPWFTVNQRGQSTYSVTGQTDTYTVDRWSMIAWSGKTVSFDVGSSGITFSAGVNSFRQRIYDIWDALVGKKLTLSIEYTSTEASGQIGIVKGGLWDSNTIINFKTGHNVDSVTFTAESGINPTLWVYIPETNTNFKIKAIKLELGEVSTLASDTAPNYATELLKCQRYFQIFGKGGNEPLGIGQAKTTTDCSLIVPLSVPMRTKPTATLDISATNAYVHLRNGITIANITNISVDIISPSSIMLVASTTNLTVGAVYEAFCMSGGIVSLSADL